MSQKRACVVSQRAHPGDARITNQIQALQEDGYIVDMIATRNPDQASYSLEEGVSTYRVPSIARQRASKLRYIIEYFSFLLPAFLWLTALHIRKGYKVVMVTNLPDPLVFCALIPRLFGAKVIFDIRECTPEMFNDRFGISMESKAMKFMVLLEQWAIKFAQLTTTCTEQMRQAVIKRGADPKRVHVMLNVGALGVTPKLPNVNEDTSQEFRIVTHGTIIKRYGHDVLIKAMPLILQKLPHARMTIFGKGNMKADLEQLVRDLKLEDKITFAGFVSQDTLINALQSAHVGAVGILRNPEADLVHTFKMFEYIELGLPIIISRTTAVEAYFNDDAMTFFEAGNSQSFADAVVGLANDPHKRLQQTQNALVAYEQFTPEKQKGIFRASVRGMFPDASQDVALPSPQTPLPHGEGLQQPHP
jgi:glycosyltransferase involved in cell wall biosynthesis